MEQILANTPIKSFDAPAFFQLAQDKDIRSEFLNLRDITSVGEAQTFIDHHIASTSSKRFLKAVRIGFTYDADSWTEEDSTLIGFISLHDTGMMDKFLSGGFDQNLSFGLARAYRGNGIMTTSVNMLLQAMITDEYNVVPSFVKPNNIASERVLLKCGFDRVRETPMGSLFVRRLAMDEYEYKRIFKLD